MLSWVTKQVVLDKVTFDHKMEPAKIMTAAECKFCRCIQLGKGCKWKTCRLQGTGFVNDYVQVDKEFCGHNDT